MYKRTFNFIMMSANSKFTHRVILFTAYDSKSRRGFSPCTSSLYCLLQYILILFRSFLSICDIVK